LFGPLLGGLTVKRSRPRSGSSHRHRRLLCRTWMWPCKLWIILTSLAGTTGQLRTIHHPTLCQPRPIDKLPRHAGQRPHNLYILHGVRNGHCLPKTTLSRLSFETRSHLYFGTLLPWIRSPLGKSKSKLSATPSTKLPRMGVSTQSPPVSLEIGILGGGSDPSYVLHD